MTVPERVPTVKKISKEQEELNSLTKAMEAGEGVNKNRMANLKVIVGREKK